MSGVQRFLGLLVCFGLAPLGCSRQPTVLRFPEAPVVLISIDTLRADHLPAYGYDRVTTPHLDRFRADAVLFERAWSTAPLTLPAHLSMLTGLLPFEHGVRDNLGYRFDATKHASLSSLLKARGYVTGAAVSAYVLRAATGIASGFEHYDDRIVAAAGDALGRAQRPGTETADSARRWLETVSDRPFFLFFHVYEPHLPYEPPAPHKSRHALAYDGEIAAADEIVGGILDDLRRLGSYDRALVVVTSDHGEGLGEHGEDDHGILLYRWALHVPLLVKLPASLRAGTSVAHPVSLVDLLPTFCDLLDLKHPAGLRGRSLFDPAPAARRLYAETGYPRIHLGWSPLFALVDERWQYIEGVGRELYDVAADPAQVKDRSTTEGEVVRARQKELADLPHALAAPSEITGEERESLRALGYLGGASEGTGPLADPRERIGTLRDLRAGFRLAADGKLEEAVVALRRILEANPLLLDARYELGRTLVRLERWEEAYEAFRAALRGSPSLAGPLALELGRVCLRLGRLEEAEANARVALRTEGPRAHLVLAQVALARGQAEVAEREAEAAATEAGTAVDARLVQTEFRIRRGQAQEALGLLDQIVRTTPEATRAADLNYLRGDALARLGRHAEAQAAFEEEIRLFPGSAQAYARLAIVLGLQGHSVAEVDRLLERMVKARPGRETIELAARTLESMGDARGARKWRARQR